MELLSSKLCEGSHSSILPHNGKWLEVRDKQKHWWSTHLSIHPSILSHLSGSVSWRQRAETFFFKGIFLPSHILLGYPDGIYCITPSVCSGSAVVPPPIWTCPEYFCKEVSGSFPGEMPKLAPFNAKEQRSHHWTTQEGCVFTELQKELHLTLEVDLYFIVRQWLVYYQAILCLN